MNNLIPENPLRTIARSHYWQTVYHRAKEIGSIKLFENTNDFTAMQIMFLYYLEEISGLYYDLALKEELISQHVIDDWIRADSYLLYKQKKREQEKLDKPKDKESGKNKDRIVFIKG